MSSSYNPLPPSVVHSSNRLTHLEAHTFLSEFITQSDLRPGYRPDSTLTENGPQAVSTGSNPNLTLHHLKTILLGMEGKKVGGGLGMFGGGDGEGEAAEEDTQTGQWERAGRTEFGTDGAVSPRSAKRKIYDVDSADYEGEDAAVEAVVGETNGWQGKDDYDLAQEDDGLDLMNEDRHPGADLDQPHDEAEEEELVNVEIEGTGEKVDPRKSIDKDERRKMKKLRQKQEKAQRLKKRRGST